MAKKTSRPVTPAPDVTVSPAPAVRRTITTGPADFNPDYSDVVKDLRRIGILAGTFFTILVVLSFFLR